jgi:tryptophan synthase alpha chain
VSGGNRGGGEIEQAIRAANDSGRPALSAFLTAGFPDRAGFANLLTSVAAEADLVEVGVPFSDPMADGVTIQRSSRAALEAGVTLRWILETVGSIATSAPLILMSYLNPLLAFGFAKLAEHAVRAGISGLIVPDLPWEECSALRLACDARGVALIQLVTPVTQDERLITICRGSRGFVYAVTVTGTTGGAAHGGDGLAPYLARVRSVSPVPVLAGFGIRSAGQLAEIGRHVHGGIVGSALIETLERGEDSVAFLRGLRSTGRNGEGASS